MRKKGYFRKTKKYGKYIRKPTYKSTRQFKSQVLRVSEMKQHTVSTALVTVGSQSLVNIPQAADNVSAIAQGTGTDERIGNRIFVKSVTITVDLDTSSSLTNVDQARLIFWYPKNPNDISFSITPTAPPGGPSSIMIDPISI